MNREVSAQDARFSLWKQNNQQPTVLDTKILRALLYIDDFYVLEFYSLVSGLLHEIKDYMLIIPTGASSK